MYTSGVIIHLTQVMGSSQGTEEIQVDQGTDHGIRIQVQVALYVVSVASQLKGIVLYSLCDSFWM